MHGLRAAAVFALVLYHCAIGVNWVPVHALPRALYESGFLSLDILFFTTGFVLFLPVVISGTLGSVGAFAIRRFARIGPPYYVCLLLILVFFPLLTSPQTASQAHNSATDYLVHLAFLQREVLGTDSGLGVNGPLWALSIDVAFYVLLPLIATVYLRRPFVGLVVALAAAAAWRIAFADPPTPANLEALIQFPLFLGDFACGMTAAWAFVRLRGSQWPRLHVRATVAISFGALAAIIGLAYAAGSTVPFHLGVFREPPLVALLFPLALLVLVVAVSVAPAWTQWPLTNRAALWFSEISYSVFLYHVPLIFFAIYTLGIFRVSQGWQMLAFVLSASIALATASYLLVERPSRRYGRRLARRVAGSRGEPAAVAHRRAAALGLENPRRL